MMTDPVSSTYPQIVAVRNAEVSTHWTRYNIQITLNSAILFTFLALRDKPFPAESVGLVVSLGSAFTAIWAAINWRGHWWLRFWNEKLAQLEKDGNLPNVFQDAIAITNHSKICRIGVLATLVPVVFSAVWCVIACTTSYGSPIRFGISVLAFAVTFAIFCAHFTTTPAVGELKQ